MTITGGFGVTVDLQSGVPRAWYMGKDGVQRWADTDEPVEGGERPTCDTPPALRA